MAHAHRPEAVQLHRQSQVLSLTFKGTRYSLSAELLRVHSPSAEVKGHHGQGGELPFGKSQVQVQSIGAVGHYALAIIFDDGHDSGIYSWDYLYRLCVDQDVYWQNYLKALHEQGLSREANTQVIRL